MSILQTQLIDVRLCLLRSQDYVHNVYQALPLLTLLIWLHTCITLLLQQHRTYYYIYSAH